MPTPNGATPAPEIDLSAGLVNSPAQRSTPGEIDLSAGLVNQGSTPQQPESTFARLNRESDTPLVDLSNPNPATQAHPYLAAAAQSALPGLGLAAVGADELQQIAQREQNHGNPYRAAIAKFFGGAMQDLLKLDSGMTSPKGAAVALASEGAGSPALNAGMKAVATLGNLYFGFRGLQAAVKNTRDMVANGVTMEGGLPMVNPDNLQGALLGTAGVTVTGALGLSSGMNMVRDVLRNKFGLGPDLSARVQAKIQEASNLRSKAESAKAANLSRASSESGQVVSHADVLRQRSIPEEVNNIMRDGAHAVVQEKARVQAPFDQMSLQMGSKGVVDADDLKAQIADAITARGVNGDEIPGAVFRAIPKAAGESTSDITDPMVNGRRLSTYDPATQTQLRASMKIPEAPAAAAMKPVTFADLTRVREDLWNAAQNAKGTDAQLSNGLFDAHNAVSDLQQKIANENGFGAKFRVAKQQYMIFKRELGSGLMDKFLRADDVQHQSIVPKLAMLTRSIDAEALATILRKAGVDVRPLLDMRDSLRALESSKDSSLQTARSLNRGIDIATARQIREIGRDADIVPGKDVTTLGGKSNEELNQMRLQKVLNDARTRGIGQPIALVMMLYGVMRMVGGSAFGLFPAMYGLTRMNLVDWLLKPEVQNWLLNDSDVPMNSPTAGRLRRGIAEAYPIARKAAKAGLLSSPSSTVPNLVPRKPAKDNNGR